MNKREYAKQKNAIIKFRASVTEKELLNKSRELDKIILFTIKCEKFCKTLFGDGIVKEFETIIDKLQLFDKVYDLMRIIDPVSKKVLEIKGNEVIETELICHDFWKKQMLCDNCISMRAYIENDTIFKIDQSGKRVYLVTAIPIFLKNRRIIIELLKDGTKNLHMGSGKHGINEAMLSTIEYINQSAVRDKLTELYNKRYINEKLPNDLFNSTLRNEPLSIIFLDINYFNVVKETYGPSVGDQVLQEFAKLLKTHIRSDKDWTARYGSEEFLICLSNTSIETAKVVAERIRKNIAQTEFDTGNGRIHLTSSFGVHTVCNETESLTIDGIIEIVDKKLYQAKVDGRNIVI